MFDNLLSTGDLYTISPPESVGMEVDELPPAATEEGPTAPKKRKRQVPSSEDAGTRSKGKGTALLTVNFSLLIFFSTLATLTAQAQTFSKDATTAAQAVEDLEKSKDVPPAKSPVADKGTRKTRSKKAKANEGGSESAAHVDTRPVAPPSFTGRPPHEVLSAAGLAFEEIHKKGPVSGSTPTISCLLTRRPSSALPACPARQRLRAGARPEGVRPLAHLVDHPRKVVWLATTASQARPAANG